MFSKTSPLKPLALAALLATTGAAQAAITVYTSLAAFTAATANPGTDTFAGLSITGSTAAPLFRTAGAYSYTADTLTPPWPSVTPGGSFFGVGTTANPGLGTDFATDIISFTGFSAGVVGLGGNFFGSNVIGAFVLGNMTVRATDASGTQTETIVGALEDGFLGFVSTTGLLSASVVSVQPTSGGFLWPSVDNLVLASAVPEPGTYAMMLAGLGALGFMARRRRS